MKVKGLKAVLIEIKLDRARMLNPQIRSLIPIGIPDPYALLLGIDADS